MSDPSSGRPRRGRYLTLLAVLLGLLLAVSFVSQWWLYRAVRGQLDEQMGERLLAVGTVVAGTIGWDGVLELSVAGPASPRYEEVRQRLREVAAQNDLDALTVIDTDRRVLVSVGSLAEPGRVDPMLEFETVLSEVIVSGQALSSPLTRVYAECLADEFLKAGYAPVVDPEGTVVGAVVVEGGRQFFTVLGELRGRLLFSAGLGFLATAALGVVFFLTLRSLVRLEDSLRGTAALAAIGQIASVVAHEIKNPLAIIRSRSERVRRKIELGKEPAEVLEWFDVIPQEVDRLNEIVTNYLSLARSERGLEGKCAVGVVAREIAALVGPDLEKRQIELDVSGAEDVEVGIGARSLKQILLNLVLNAADAIDAGAIDPGAAPSDAAPSDGRAPGVEESTSHAAASGASRRGGVIRIASRSRSVRWIEVRVEDDGRGMTADERSSILEPFFTTKSTGSGLGLTLVQSLVQSSGGRLEIESQRGRGTVVGAVLPTRAPGGGESA
ncbi:MAG: ATP-binding protein [Candidatus Eisenbacteria bacterium]